MLTAAAETAQSFLRRRRSRLFGWSQLEPPFLRRLRLDLLKKQKRKVLFCNSMNSVQFIRTNMIQTHFQGSVILPRRHTAPVPYLLHRSRCLWRGPNPCWSGRLPAVTCPPSTIWWSCWTERELWTRPSTFSRYI